MAYTVVLRTRRVLMLNQWGLSTGALILQTLYSVNIGCVHMRTNHVPKDVSDHDPKCDWDRDLNYVHSHALQTPSQSRSGSAHCKTRFKSLIWNSFAFTRAKIRLSNQERAESRSWFVLMWTGPPSGSKRCNNKLFWFLTKAKKKKCYVALTRPKFKNWVGRSGFFFFFFFFNVPWDSWVFQYFFLSF